VRRQVQEMKETLERELAEGQLAGEPQKLLQSLRRHWAGLTVFVEHPQVPMDNNAAERANRPLPWRARTSTGAARSGVVNWPARVSPAGHAAAAGDLSAALFQA